MLVLMALYYLNRKSQGNSVLNLVLRLSASIFFLGTTRNIQFSIFYIHKLKTHSTWQSLWTEKLDIIKKMLWISASGAVIQMYPYN